MKKLNLAVATCLCLSITSCAMFKKSEPQKTASKTNTPVGTNVQTENKNKEAFSRAAALTNGWPDSSITAAKEMISKYGEPHETTSETLVWRNIAPFKEIIVHKEVYSHKFPLLHQNSLEHVVDYRAPIGKIDDVWRYNGSIVLNQTKGEMSSYSDNEAMNILALNLAHQVMTGKMSADAARVTYGKETMNYMNGLRTEKTQVLAFGSQFNTSDPGVSITNKIRWIGDPARQATPAKTQDLNTRQAQEEKK